MKKEGFIYIWFDSKHKKYYLGCHWGTVEDGYICSSNNMRNNYRNRPGDFRRRIIKRGIAKEDLLAEEHKWLSLIKEEELGNRYYNLYTTNTALRLAWAASKGRKQPQEEIDKRAASNRGKKRTEETKRRIAEAHKGKKRGPLSDEHRKKVSESLCGEKNPFYGKQHDPELKKRMNEKTSNTMKGRVPKNIIMIHQPWWNNGIKNTRASECPGDGWFRGRI